MELHAGRHHQAVDGRLHDGSAAQGQGCCGLTALRLLAAAVFLAGAASAATREISETEAMAALVAAYPDALVKYEGRSLHWRDGTVSEIGNDALRPFEQMLRGATLLDQLRLPYPRGALATTPARDDDPGRFRNVAFFRKMYGDCRRGEMQKQLVPIVWLPNTWGHTIRVTAVNGIAQKLQDISSEIELLPEQIKRAAFPSAGGYACRGIVDTGQPSMHAYGAAIDLNFAYSDYWYWQRAANGAISYRNRMPAELVEIFERRGFIWGGKWYHYDTMHFEYRPELIALAGR